MFIGHFAVGFAGRRVAPELGLGIWVLATQWVDLIWPLFLLLGWERVEIDPGNTAVTPLDFTHYPWTHSLLFAVVWGAVFALVLRWRGHSLAAAGWAAGGVLSHWVLDFLTHRPDLPLWPGGPLVGLGLWNSVLGTVVVELSLYAVGVAVYFSMTRARDRTGNWAFWGLVAFLALVYASNLLGPPPPSAGAIGWVGLSMWLLVAWAFWIDRHRMAA